MAKADRTPSAPKPVEAQRMLGRSHVEHDARTLKMARYYQTLPPPPQSVDWGARTNGKWPMFRNDQLGCCTCAAAGHMIEVWTASESKEAEVRDDDVVRAYSDTSGYVLGDASTDRGGSMLKVLRYWRKQGIGAHKIGAFVSVHGQTNAVVRTGIALFGGLYVGMNLPRTAQEQDIWDAVPGSVPDAIPGTWGGHAVNAVGYDNEHVHIVTWGALKKVTWAFWQRYVDEAYAVLSPDFIDPLTGKSPDGVDLETLKTDLARITA